MDKLVPKLRFPEFEGNFRKHTLGDICKFSKGKGVSKSNIVSDGKNECIRYGELYTTYNEVIEEVFSRTNLEKADYVISEVNDIIIPSSGESAVDIATASCVLKEGVLLGGDLNILKTNENGVFLSYYLNNQKKGDIAKLAQGNTVVHLYNKGLATLRLSLPSLPEQTKITEFLTAIDKRIELLTAKKEKLTLYKKGVMQKIFNQEIRFKDENGEEFPEWEEATLSQLCDVRDGTHDSPKYVGDTNNILITSKNLMPSGGIDLKNVNCISDSDFEKVNKRSKVDVGDILFGMIGTIGNAVIVRKAGFAIKNIALIKFSNRIKNEYLLQYLKSELIQEVFRVLSTGNTQKFISLTQIRNLVIPVPDKVEQTRIAAFLNSLDSELDTIDQQINLNQTYKKGLLQQMFV